MNTRISVFFHNYYGFDTDWFAFFKANLPSENFSIFYNCVIDSFYRKNIEIDTTLLTKNLYIRLSPNKGKDLGGKLVLMDSFLKMAVSSKYLLLMHDKNSLYHANKEKWTKQLFKIATKDYTSKAIELFNKDDSIGIVAIKDSIKNGYDNIDKKYTNKEVVEILKVDYGIIIEHPQYVAGTMFWVRASIYQDFFSKNHPLDIRKKLEKGNVMDHEKLTTTHLWERIMSWIVTSSGYKIVGI